MTTTEASPWPLGDAIKQAREARGWTIDEATFQARTRFPDLKLRRSKIHRYESSLNPDRIDITVAAALCELYGIDLEGVDPDLYSWWTAVKRLATTDSPCTPEDPYDGPDRRLKVA